MTAETARTSETARASETAQAPVTAPTAESAQTPAAWRGGQVLEGAWCVLAPNPSPMTLDGTNTWILWAPGSSECAVLDPGPLHEGHLQAVAAQIEALGLRCVRVLLSHRHLDHTEGAQHFADLVGAPIDFPGRDHPESTEPMDLGVDGLSIQGIPTPGHTSDSYCFHVPALRALLTGDTILGRGTTVVAWPDGAIRPYLASLATLRDLVSGGGVGVLLPGHGAPRNDALQLIDEYAQHRHERLDQVRDVVRELGVQLDAQQANADRSSTAGSSSDQSGIDQSDTDPSDTDRDALVERVVETVYAQVPREVWPAARLSVRAQLDYLAESDGAS